MTAPLGFVPTVTDHLPIALRAYAVPLNAKTSGSEPGTPNRKRKPLKASKWSVIFDTETTTDPGQSLRFGTYQVRAFGALHESGIFYEPAAVTNDELNTLDRHAAAMDLQLLTRDEFVDRIFYGIGYKLRATIVGFNLPFDISRIAVGHGSARKTMREGFTFKLSADKRLPNVQVKHLSQRNAFIRFAAPMRQRQNRSDRKHGRTVRVRRGHFVDIKTLGSALFARSFSLASLSTFLKITHGKLAFGDFAGPITDQMATYAVRDVQATWDCYAELVGRYEQLGLTDTPPEKIYSEASIGKGYLKAMGIRPWRTTQPDFPPQMLANIMGSYFGGRSEVRIRREVRQVMLCDFMSMYPTVCTLMGLWRFVIADGMTWRDATAETRDMLGRVDTEMLKSQPIWRELPVLVRVKPQADIFPVRAQYGVAEQSTIGANYLTSEQPLWFTLADCIASKLLSGETPEIVEAIAFEPGPLSADLKPVSISGNQDYAVDPRQDDFYKRVIELRQAIKGRRDSGSDLDYATLDTEQNALKIAANATSYGVFVEVNVSENAVAAPFKVYSSTAQPFGFDGKLTEEPGPFFHPLLAALITGAARLMLAITERLVGDAKLDWSFCDTDSMAIAKPDEMSVQEFSDKVQQIAEWFMDLNPYDFKGSILKIEDVSYHPTEPGTLVPLFCWAVSSKRYALFNLDRHSKPVLRKASAHGLGHLRTPYDANNPARGIPAPELDLLKIGVELWQHDLWHQIISAALSGQPDQVDLAYHPALNWPAISRYGATSPRLLRWFRQYNHGRNYADQVKPFGFLLALTVEQIAAGEEILQQKPTGRERSPKPIKPIAPFNLDPAVAASTAFDRETGNAVPASALKTYRQAIAQYHLHPEAKFLNGDYVDRGATRRRHVVSIAIQCIGKEANRWEEQFFVGLDDEAAPSYGQSPEQVEAILAELSTLTRQLGRDAVAKQLKIPVSKLTTWLRGKPSARGIQTRVISKALQALRDVARVQGEGKKNELAAIKSSIADIGLRATARLYGLDPSNLRRKLKGRFKG